MWNWLRDPSTVALLAFVLFIQWITRKKCVCVCVCVRLCVCVRACACMLASHKQESSAMRIKKILLRICIIHPFKVKSLYMSTRPNMTCSFLFFWLSYYYSELHLLYLSTSNPSNMLGVLLPYGICSSCPPNWDIILLVVCSLISFKSLFNMTFSKMPSLCWTFNLSL